MDVSIIVPTFNEAEGIEYLLFQLHQAMQNAHFSWEVIVVDDSTDETPQLLQTAAQTYPWLRFYHRQPKERNGLSGAILFGMQEANGYWIVSMDSDGQHPPVEVRRMISLGMFSNFDVIMATRYAQAGSTVGLDGPMRHLASSTLRWIPRVLFPRKMWWVSDPLGGFFMVRKEVLNFQSMRAIGWKVSLEVLLMSDYGRSLQFPYTFERRHAGESKAGAKVAVDYLRQIASLFWRYYIWRR